MAARVLKFEQSHPSSDAGQVGLTTQLAALFETIDDLVQSTGRSDAGERAARERRRKLRRNIADRLRHLRRVADVAALGTPTLAGRFEPPAHNAPSRVFIAGARRMLADATVEQELLLPAGLGASTLADLAAIILQYDAASGEADDARGDHVGARAQLAALTGQVMQLVGVLDGLNNARLATSPDLMAEWTSARNVFGPVTGGTRSATPAEGEQPGAAA